MKSLLLILACALFAGCQAVLNDINKGANDIASAGNSTLQIIPDVAAAVTGVDAVANGVAKVTAPPAPATAATTSTK